MAKTFVIVKVIVLNDKDEVLILKRGMTAPRRPGAWDLPGGFVDKGEDISVAAIRETGEETGIKLKRVNLLYGETSHEDGLSATGVHLMFIGKATGRNHEISWEHDEAKWVPAAELDKHVTEGKQAPAVRYIVEHDLFHAEFDTHP